MNQTSLIPVFYRYNSFPKYLEYESQWKILAKPWSIWSKQIPEVYQHGNQEYSWFLHFWVWAPNMYWGSNRENLHVLISQQHCQQIPYIPSGWWKPWHARNSKPNNWTSKIQVKIWKKVIKHGWKPFFKNIVCGYAITAIHQSMKEHVILDDIPTYLFQYISYTGIYFLKMTYMMQHNQEEYS